MTALTKHVDENTYDFGLNLTIESADFKKSARTRAAICRAGCEVLNRTPLSALTVADICQEAGIAHGTFYIYFGDSRVFVAELLDQFIGFVQHVLHRESHDAEDPVRAATTAYYRLFAANPGLMKCLVFHLEEFPSTRAASQKLNRGWITTVVTAAERQFARAGRAGAIPHDELMRRGYALGGMVDQYLAALFLSNDPGVAEVSRDMDKVIDSLTHIWNHGLTT